MTDITFVKTRPTSQVEHAEAVARGFAELGLKTHITLFGSHLPTKHVVCWGWRLGTRLRQLGHEVLVMERGYVGDRFSYSSLGWNGLNGCADFPEYPADNGERFAQLGVEIKPWKTGGDYALILGQVPRDASLKGLDMLPFYEEWARQVKDKFGLPVRFRQHPEVTKRGVNQSVCGAERSTGTLGEDLSHAALCLTYNSNSSVDSVLAGVPTFVADRGSMAWDVCSHRIGERATPAREVWVHKLAWTQWTIKEIASGFPLEKIAAEIRLG